MQTAVGSKLLLLLLAGQYGVALGELMGKGTNRRDWGGRGQRGRGRRFQTAVLAVRAVTRSRNIYSNQVIKWEIQLLVAV